MKRRIIGAGLLTCVGVAVILVAQHWPTAMAQPQPQVEVAFLSDNYSVGEGNATITITVFLAQSSSSTVTVDYATSSGTATGDSAGGENGGDYGTVSGTLVFAPYQTSRTIVVDIYNDQCCESNETFTVTLSNAVGGSIGTPSTTTVTILDNDSGCPS